MNFGASLDEWSIEGRRLTPLILGTNFLSAIAITMLSPFGTGDDPYAWRLAYWFLMIVLYGHAVLPATIAMVRRRSSVRNMTAAAGLPLLVVMSAIPMSVTVWVFDQVLPWMARLVVPEATQNSAAGLWDLSALNLIGLLGLYFKVLAVCALLAGLLLLSITGIRSMSAELLVRRRPGQRFFSRLPGSMGCELILLQMQDHYMRVVAKGGEALILLAMHEATVELDGVDGVQVHRSWWVALNEVRRLARDGRRLVAIMSNGVRVPVSETYRTELEHRMGTALGKVSKTAA